MWQPSAADRSQAVDLLIPSNHTTSSNAGSRDLHAVTKARYQKEMREELLSKGALVSLYHVYGPCHLLYTNTVSCVKFSIKR